jgi:hypothetical protein
MFSFSIQEIPRFRDLVIKSDKEVADFRNKIYTKIKRVNIICTLLAMKN